VSIAFVNVVVSVALLMQLGAFFLGNSNSDRHHVTPMLLPLLLHDGQHREKKERQGLTS